MNEIEALKKEIARHNKLYYEESSPEISDAEYDNLTKKLRQLIGDNNYQEDLFSIGINNISTKFQKMDHLSPMLSLGNVFSEEELQDFLKKINNFLNTENHNYEFVAEKKIDGVSFSALYENGKLIHILTRGDGVTGENITENILTIDGFPTKIHMMQKLEVRGEVYMLNVDFQKLNEENLKNRQKIFANPRNAASGSLRQLDSSITSQRNLKYFAYSLIFYEENNVQTQAELYEELKNNGFAVNDYCVCKSITEMLKYYNSIAEKRFELEYDIDGIVYKVNSLSLQKRLGVTANAPRWAVAHKFFSKKVHTKIENITVQIGRTGIITPVAELLPVNLGGVVIKRATLHNRDEILRLGVNIGDIVEIERAGDVIPKILKIIQKNSEGVYDFPRICPYCNAELIQVETVIRCLNIMNCNEQKIGKLQYFASKDCFNIVGLGEKQIEEFYHRGTIKTYADIFTLPQKIEDIKLYEWEGWGKISVQNLINAIEKAKNVTLSRFINSLGIYSVGTENAKLLAEFFQNGENMLNDFTINSLTAIDGIGEKTANEVILHLQNYKNEIRDLLQYITFAEEKSITNPNKGMVLFTGTLSISRAEAKELAQNAGYKIASSVSKNLTYLIAGEDAGSKLKKAQELGVQIINEKEFLLIAMYK